MGRGVKKMINKKIALSAMSILSALAIMGGATFAYFSDTGTSSQNTFSSGTLNMKLSDADQTDQDNVGGTWGLNSAPGDTFTGILNIKNTGNVAANHVELKFTNVVTPAASGPGTLETNPLDKVIEITAFGWDTDGNGSLDQNLLPGVTNTNGNGIIDLDDLENQTVDDFDNLSFGGLQGNNHALRIDGRLSPTLATNEHQGDSVNMSLDVTMNQDASQ